MLLTFDVQVTTPPEERYPVDQAMLDEISHRLMRVVQRYLDAHTTINEANITVHNGADLRERVEGIEID